MIDKIKQLAEDQFEMVRGFRRHLHAHPELSFEETNTQAFIRKALEDIGLTDIQDCANTGLVAMIKGKTPDKKTVALRGDIDALPITEISEAEYCSKNKGVMHACGHDVHTSSLLGAARILFNCRNDFEGQVKLIFQPGEERLPGGASIMIKEGVLQNPQVDSILGQHVMPLVEVGKVGFRPGLYMASADEIYIKVIGKGGHGAHPHMAIDPIAISAQLITALQQIVSRRAKPAMPSVLTIGRIEGLGSTNVIPDSVYMEGTFRTFDETWRLEAHALIENYSKQLVEAMGGQCEIEVRKGYPHLKNHEALTSAMRKAAEDYMGAENVVDLDIWPAGEDFAFYSQEVPACFYRLGTRNEAKGITHMLHTPRFDVDEESLLHGPGLMAYLAMVELTS